MIRRPPTGYRVIERLASGGMADVYLVELARPGGFAKRFVLKRLRAPEEPDGRARHASMMIEEARLCARLDHPNVCHLYDAWIDSDDAAVCLLLEYLPGLSFLRLIQHRLVDHRLADLRFLLGLFEPACRGLEHAHHLADDRGVPLGVVHRDISPSNLFVTFDGIPRLLDFGIAKTRTAGRETRPGLLKGKLGYMAPEQVRGAAIDQRTDVFAMAVTFFELATGRRLFRRASEAATMRAIVEEDAPRLEPLRPDAPAALCDAIAAALRRDPARRLQSAAALGDAFAAAARELGTPVDPHLVARTLAIAGLVAPAAADPRATRPTAEVELAVVDDLAETDALDRPAPAGAPTRGVSVLIQILVAVAALSGASWMDAVSAKSPTPGTTLLPSESDMLLLAPAIAVLSMTGAAPAPHGGTVVAQWFEAESAALTAPFEVVTDPLASEGAYVTANSGSDTSGTGDVTVGAATFTVEIAEAGDYYVWGRFLGPNGDANSFWLIVDGGARYEWSHPQDVWDWDLGGGPYALTAGTHQVVVKVREDGDQFDRLMITSDPTLEPTGLGSRCGDAVCTPDEDVVTCAADCDPAAPGPDAGVDPVDGGTEPDGGVAGAADPTSLYGCSASGGPASTGTFLLLLAVLGCGRRTRLRTPRRGVIDGAC